MNQAIDFDSSTWVSLTPVLENCTYTLSNDSYAGYYYASPNMLYFRTTLRGAISEVDSPGYSRIRFDGMPNTVKTRFGEQVSTIRECDYCTVDEAYSVIPYATGTISITKPCGIVASQWRTTNQFYISIVCIIFLGA